MNKTVSIFWLLIIVSMYLVNDSECKKTTVPRRSGIGTAINKGVSRYRNRGLDETLRNLKRPRGKRDINELQVFYEFLVAQGLNRLCKLFREASLDETLDSIGSFTIFAPTDDAFDFLEGKILEEIENDPSKLQGFIMYHLAPGSLTTADLLDDSVINSGQGAPLRFNTYENGNVITVSGSQITKPNLKTGEIIVHIIDHVLYPPPKNNLPNEIKSNYNTMYRLCEEAELTEILSDKSCTVFVPNDQAFRILPPSIRNAIYTNATLLQRILLNHIIPGTFFRAGLPVGFSLQPLDGNPLIFSTKRGMILVNGIPIIHPDIIVTNGVMHVLNRVLLPPDVLEDCKCISPTVMASTTTPQPDTEEPGLPIDEKYEDRYYPEVEGTTTVKPQTKEKLETKPPLIPTIPIDCDGELCASTPETPKKEPVKPDCPNGNCPEEPEKTDCPEGNCPEEPVKPDCPEGNCPEEPAKPDCPEGNCPDEPAKPDCPEGNCPEEPVKPDCPEGNCPEEPVKPDCPEGNCPEEPAKPDCPEGNCPVEPAKPDCPEGNCPVEPAKPDCPEGNCPVEPAKPDCPEGNCPVEPAKPDCPEGNCPVEPAKPDCPEGNCPVEPAKPDCPEGNCPEEPAKPGCPEGNCPDEPARPDCPEGNCSEEPAKPDCPEGNCPEEPAKPDCPEGNCPEEPAKPDCPEGNCPEEPAKPDCPEGNCPEEPAKPDCPEGNCPEEPAKPDVDPRVKPECFGNECVGVTTDKPDASECPEGETCPEEPQVTPECPPGEDCPVTVTQNSITTQKPSSFESRPLKLDGTETTLPTTSPPGFQPTTPDMIRVTTGKTKGPFDLFEEVTEASELDSSIAPQPTDVTEPSSDRTTSATEKPIEPSSDKTTEATEKPTEPSADKTSEATDKPTEANPDKPTEPSSDKTTEATEEPTEPSADKTSEATDKPTEPSSDKTTEATEKPTTEATEKPTETTSDKPTEPNPDKTTEANEKPTEPSSDKTTEATDKPTEPSSDKTTEATDKPTEPSSDKTTEATDKPTEPSSDKTTEATDKPTEPSSDKTTEATDKPTEPSSDKTTEATNKPTEATNKPTEPSSDKTTEATDKPTEPSSDKATEATDKPTEPSSDETTEATEKPTEPSSDKTTEATDKPTEPSSDKTTEATEKPTEPSSDKTTEATDKPTEPSSDKTTEATDKSTEPNLDKTTEATEKPTEPSSDKTTEATDKPTEPSSDKTTEATVKPTEATEKPTEPSPDKTTEATEKPSESSPDETTTKANDKPTEPSSDKTTEATEKPTEPSSDKTTEASEKPTEPSSDKTTEATGKTTEPGPDKTSETTEPSSESPDKTTEGTSETPFKIADRKSEKSTEAPVKPTEPTSDKPTEKPTEPTSDKPTEKPTEPTSDKPTEKPTEPTSDKPTEKPTEPTSDKPTEKPTEPTSDKPTEKPTEPTSDKPTEKPTEPTSDKPTEKPTEPTSDKPVDPIDYVTLKPPQTKSPETSSAKPFSEKEPDYEIITSTTTEPYEEPAVTEPEVTEPPPIAQIPELSCANETNKKPPSSVVDFLNQPGLVINKKPVSFKVVINLFNTAGLTPVLRRRVPYTLCVPTDEAFTSLSKDGVNKLRADMQKLRKLLLFHVIASQLPNYSLRDNTLIKTNQGSPVIINVQNRGKLVLIGGSKVIGSRKTPFGQIYVINKPITKLPQESVLKALRERPNVSQFYHYILGCPLSKTLQGNGPYTIMAPTNEAFRKIPQATLNNIRTNKKALERLLNNHVVRSACYSSSVNQNKVVPTIQRGKLRFIRSQGQVLINNARIMEPDISTGNGVVHVINRVLIPDTENQLSHSVPVMKPRNPMLDKLSHGLGVDKFVNFLTESGIMSKLEDGRSYTIFAPTDTAIQNLPPTLLRNIQNNPNQMLPIVKYHIIPSAIQFNQLRDETTLQTLLPNKDVRFNYYHNDTVITVAGAPIGPVRMMVGLTLCVVNKVLYPPIGDISKTVSKSPILQDLSKALKLTGLDEELSEMGPYTLFAPTEAAFRQLPKADFLSLFNDNDKLRDMISRHLLRGTLFSAGVSDHMTTRAINGGEMNLSLKPQCIVVNGVNVLYSDITATNGVVHVLDHLL